MYSSILWLIYLIPIAFIAGIVYLIIYLVGRKNKPNVAPMNWRRFGVGVAISLILPFFIGFSTSAVFGILQDTNPFIMMVVMSVIFLIVGLAIAHHTVISTSLIIGSLIALIYAIGLNIDTVPPVVIAILAGLGLALLVYFAYKKFQEKEVK